MDHNKNRIDKTEKRYGRNFLLKYLGYILVTLSLITPIEQNKWRLKKSIFGTECNFLWDENKEF